MALQVSKLYGTQALKLLRSRLLPFDDSRITAVEPVPECDDIIAEFNVDEAFNECLNQFGIIGYGYNINEVGRSLRKADATPAKDTFASITDLVGIVQKNAGMIAVNVHPGDSVNSWPLQTQIINEFWRVFAMYATFSKPQYWSIDFQQDDGAFGILLFGDYTCLVMVSAVGNVSGHS